MLEILQIIGSMIAILTGSFTLLVFVSKPFRRKFLENKEALEQEHNEVEERRETDRCLLRERILATYYNNKDEKKMRQYEYENVQKMYHQYQKLGGNSFICKAMEDIATWEIDNQ